MTTYQYTRLFSNGKWNINNLNDVDANGLSVVLASRIKENPTIGDKLIDVCLNDTLAAITMNADLDAADKQILDDIVSTHENASGTINKTSYLPLISENGTNYLLYVDDAGQLQVMAE